MQVNKRAAIRREQKQMEKLMNRKENTEEVLMAKAFALGKKEGLELAVGIIFLALHEYYGFGEKRLMKLLDCISIESRKMDEAPTQFNVEWYIRQLSQKCNIKFER